jgi:hypothetical protein
MEEIRVLHELAARRTALSDPHGVRILSIPLEAFFRSVDLEMDVVLSSRADLSATARDFPPTDEISRQL